jgi:hypothetical protein
MRGPSLVTALLVVAVLSAGPGNAQSILERRYTSAKLGGLWQATLGAAAPETEWFTLLAPGSGAAAPVRDAPPAGIVGLPFPIEVIGESTAPGGTTVRKAFPVIPLPAEEAAVLNRRLAWAEIYLNRYRYFEAVSTDGAETLATLTARQYAAALEAYLITARLYFSANDLPVKCLRLKRMREIDEGALSRLAAGAPLPDWRPLVALHSAAAARLGSDELARLVCAVEPVRGRAETALLVETRVRERIVQQLRRQVQDTLTLLEGASTEFQGLVNQMDVLIKSAEIMELERVLGNARANMLLVKEDQLKAAETIAALQAVDLAALNQPGQLSEFEQGRTRMAATVALIDGVMGALASLAQVTGDPTIAAELAPCTELRGAYPALDLSRDTASLAQQINGPYLNCIARARTVVDRFQEPSLDQALLAELARHVRQLSETYLTTVNP